MKILLAAILLTLASKGAQAAEVTPSDCISTFFDLECAVALAQPMPHDAHRKPPLVPLMICKDTTIVFEKPIDITDKCFRMYCEDGQNCELNGDGLWRLFETRGYENLEDSSHQIEFEDITFNRGCSGHWQWGVDTSGADIRMVGGTTTFTRCTFSAGDADAGYPGQGGCSGGAVSARRGNQLQVHEEKVTFIDCLFESNHGGAIFAPDGGTFELKNCKFIGNDSPLWGAAILANGGTWIVEDCLFEDNFSNGVYGGAISSQGAWDCPELPGNWTLKNDTFENNKALLGGAILVKEGDWAFDGCTWIGNEATEGEGGAILSWEDGRCWLRQTFTNCAFINNTARAGGGAATFYEDNEEGEWYHDSYVIIEDTEFIDNVVLDVDGFAEGGAVFLGGTGTFRGVKFIDNHSKDKGGAIYADDASATTLINTLFKGNTAVGRGNDIFFEFWLSRFADANCSDASNVFCDGLDTQCRPREYCEEPYFDPCLGASEDGPECL